MASRGVLGMEPEWRTPGIGRALIALLVLAPVLAVPVTLLLNATATAYFIAMVMCYAIIGAVFALVRREMRGLRSAVHRPVDSTPLEVRRAIEGALTRAGRSYEARPSQEWGEVDTLDVDGGLLVTVVPTTGRCIVYVGQAEGGTRAGRERLQRLVDAALGNPPA